MITPPQGQRMCSRCAEWFPETAEHFYRNRTRPDGLDIYCKACRCAIQRDYYWRSRNAIREQQTDYYQRNRPAIVARNVRRKQARRLAAAGGDR